MNPYFSIDIETTGLDPEHDQILEIGIVFDDWVTPVDQLPTLRLLLKHKVLRGNLHAFVINADLLKEMQTAKLTHPDHAADLIFEFFRNCQPDGKIVLAGKNVGSFDIQFLKRLHYWGELGGISYRYLDPGSMMYDPAADEAPPDLIKCLERAGREPTSLHTALGDALDVVHIMRYLCT